eukprot:2030500-Ditylum_brightwellii.AAC.1
MDSSSNKISSLIQRKKRIETLIRGIFLDIENKSKLVDQNRMIPVMFNGSVDIDPVDAAIVL